MKQLKTEKIKTEPKSILKVKKEPKSRRIKTLKMAIPGFEPMLTPKIEGVMT